MVASSVPLNKAARIPGLAADRRRIRELTERLDAAERYLESVRGQLAETTDATASNPGQARDLLDMAEMAVIKARQSLE